MDVKHRGKSNHVFDLLSLKAVAVNSFLNCFVSMAETCCWFFSHFTFAFLPMKSSPASLSPLQLWFAVRVSYIDLLMLFESQIKMGVCVLCLQP